MRYRVRGIEIRSENAAKPHSSAGKWVLEWICGLPRNCRVVDIGCGKLRYTIPLCKRVVCVTAVDSAIQLTRVQTLRGKHVCVVDYIKRYLQNVRLCTLEHGAWVNWAHDVALCTNVLSAIPNLRSRRKLLSDARASLRIGGKILITTQFRNSHFKAWANNPNAEKYLDGYLVRSNRGTSFYGLIGPNRLRQLCLREGFAVEEYGTRGEIAFVLATRT